MLHKTIVIVIKFQNLPVTVRNDQIPNSERPMQSFKFKFRKIQEIDFNSKISKDKFQFEISITRQS